MSAAIPDVHPDVQPEAEPEAPAESGQIRAFRREDIPAIVALRQRVFRLSERVSGGDLGAYLERLFFPSPAPESRLHSFVYEDARGGVAGFLGVVPRRMLFHDHTIEVAVATQLMVSPDCREMAGRRLARTLIAGPQDLTISDTANDGARRLWESVGGYASVGHSMSWTRVLRPSRFAAGRRATTRTKRALAFGARPLCAAIDAVAARLSDERTRLVRDDVALPMNGARHVEEMEQILERWTLRPRYDRAALDWMLGEVAQRRACGALQQVIVRNAKGRALGWFIYHRNGGGVAQVVQCAALKSAFGRVFAQFVRHARARGVTALTGRLEPSSVRELAQEQCVFTREGPWMLVHSRHEAVLRAVEYGRSFLSRLEGEWWLRF